MSATNEYAKRRAAAHHKRLLAKQAKQRVLPDDDLPELDDLRPPVLLPGEQVTLRDLDYGHESILSLWSIDGQLQPAKTVAEWMPLAMRAERDQATFRLRYRLFRHRAEVVVCTDYIIGVRQNGPLFGPPLLFETMLFSSQGPVGPAWRYATADAARQGHYRIAHALWAANRREHAARWSR